MSQRFIVIIILISFVFSCNKNDDTDISLFKNSREKWEAYKISDYVINERISCFCGGVLQWDLEVKNNTKSEVTFDQSNSNETAMEVLEKARTIEDVFDFIESIDVNSVASLIVEYDDKYGFPTLVSIDYDVNIADDEIAYIYSEFNPSD